MERLRTSRVPVRIDLQAQADLVLARYFPCDGGLSRVYWPRALRTFLAALAEAAAGVVDAAETPALRSLPEKLRGTGYVRVQDRLLLDKILRSSSLKDLCPQQLGHTAAAPLPGWPEDIDDVSDLDASLARRSLRSDVKGFLWRLAAQPEDRPLKLNYRGGSAASARPISVEVPDAQTAETIHSRLCEADKLALHNGCRGLLPNQLVEVRCDDRLAARVSVVEESGIMPWRDGTMGGYIGDSRRLYGITAGHVHRDSSDRELVSSISAKVDVSFVPLKDDSSDSVICNAMPLRMLLPHEVGLTIGEEVYKMGHATGLQIGRLKEISTDFQCPVSKNRYEDHVEVEWQQDEDRSRFAFDGDCGSLYCVRRGGMFVPIAIHRVSNGGPADDADGGPRCSYGCNFEEALALLVEGREDDAGELCFQNPCYCSAAP